MQLLQLLKLNLNILRLHFHFWIFFDLTIVSNFVLLILNLFTFIYRLHVQVWYCLSWCLVYTYWYWSSFFFVYAYYMLLGVVRFRTSSIILRCWIWGYRSFNCIFYWVCLPVIQLNAYVQFHILLNKCLTYWWNIVFGLLVFLTYIIT